MSSAIAVMLVEEPNRKICSIALSGVDDAMLIGYGNGTIELRSDPHLESDFESDNKGITIAHVSNAIRKVCWCPHSQQQQQIGKANNNNNNNGGRLGRRFAVCGEAGVYVFTEPTGLATTSLLWEETSLKYFALDTLDIVWSVDGSFLAAGGCEAKLVVWESNLHAAAAASSAISSSSATSFKPVHILDNRVVSGWIFAIRFDPLDRFIATSEGEDVVIRRTHDVQEVIRYSKVGLVAQGARIAWSIDGKLLCIGGADGGNVVLIDRKNLAETTLKLTSSIAKVVNCACFSPVLYSPASNPVSSDVTSHALLAVSGANSLSIWGSHSPHEAHVFEKVGAVLAVEWSRRGNVLFALSDFAAQKRILRISIACAGKDGTLVPRGNTLELLRKSLGQTIEGNKKLKVSMFPNTVDQMQFEDALAAKQNNDTQPAEKLSSASPSRVTQGAAVIKFVGSQTETIGQGGKRRIKPLTAVVVHSNAGELPSAPSLAAEEDCGKCKYCLDKTKNGGKNVLRKACLNKPRIRKGAEEEEVEVESEADEHLMRQYNQFFRTFQDESQEDQQQEYVDDSDLDDLPSSNAYGVARFKHHKPLTSLKPMFLLQNAVSLGHKSESVVFQNGLLRVLDQEGLYKYSLPFAGRIVFVGKLKRYLLVITTNREVHSFYLDSGTAYAPVVALGESVATVHHDADGELLCVLCQDAKLYQFEVASRMKCVVRGVVVDPILRFHLGRQSPALLSLDGSKKAQLLGGNYYELRITKNKKLVVLTCILEKKECCAFFLSADGMWLKILTLSARFVGSQYFFQGGLNGEVVNEVTSRLTVIYENMLNARNESRESQLIGATRGATADAVGMITLSHVESILLACNLLDSEREYAHWLNVYIDKVVECENVAKARQLWKHQLSGVEEGSQSSSSSYKQIILAKLASKRVFQDLLEEINEMKKTYST